MTESKGPKGLQLESGALKGPKLLVYKYRNLYTDIDRFFLCDLSLSENTYASTEALMVL